MTITEPGFYDLPETQYHADPIPDGSFSQSGLKILLEEGGPARYQAAKKGPRKEKPEWDFGTAVHTLVLGTGAQIRVLNFDSWRTKASKEAAALARLDGEVPILEKDYGPIEEAANKVLELAGDYFKGGTPEQSMFWRHNGDGPWLRGRMDYYVPGEYIVDLKTMRDTTTRGIDRDVWDFRYYYQAAWYRRGVHALTGKWLPYIIVAVEKTEPYLCRIIEVPDDYLAIGETHMDKALDLYRECTETGIWPGHPSTPLTVLAPPWAMDEMEEMVI